MAEERLEHRAEVAVRVKEYMDLVREVHDWPGSKFAQLLGYDSCEVLDELLYGVRHHSWQELESFCGKAGLNKDWLKDGSGGPFHVVKGFWRSDVEKLKDLGYWGEWRVAVVRSNCRYGRVAVLVKINDLVWRVHRARVHVSGENGAGGNLDLIEFFRTLKCLMKDWKPKTWGYTLDEEQFGLLVSGKIFPGQVMQGLRTDYWIDDLLDPGPYDEARMKQLAAHGREFRAAQSAIWIGLDEPY